MTLKKSINWFLVSAIVLGLSIWLAPKLPSPSVHEIKITYSPK